LSRPGVAGLPPNEQLKNVIGKLRRTHSEAESRASVGPSFMCGLCEHVKAAVDCVQCQVPLCGNCSEYLHQKGMYRQHTLNPLAGGRTVPRPLRRCEEHNKELDLFCVEDEIIVCSHCLLVGSHQNHRCISLKEASKLCKGQIGDKTEEVQAKRDRYAEGKSILEERVPQVHRRFTAATECIVDRFAELRAVLEERERDMVEKMCTVRDAKLYLLTRQIAELDVVLDRATGGLTDSQRYMQMVDDTDIINDFKNLIGRLESLSTTECELAPSADDKYSFKFDAKVEKAVAGFGSVDTDIVTEEISDAIRSQAIEIERQRLSRDDSSVSNTDEAGDVGSLPTVGPGGINGLEGTTISGNSTSAAAYPRAAPGVVSAANKPRSAVAPAATQSQPQPQQQQQQQQQGQGQGQQNWGSSVQRGSMYRPQGVPQPAPRFR
jgi:hypothetical protein